MGNCDIMMYYIDMNIEALTFIPCYGDAGILPVTWKWDHAGGYRTGAFVIWSVLGGQGKVCEAGQEYDIERGRCFLWRMAKPHRGRHDSRNPLRVPWCAFDVVDAYGRIVMPDTKCWPSMREAPRVDFIAGLINRAVRAFNSGSPGRFEETSVWLKAAMMEYTALGSPASAKGLTTEQQHVLYQICGEISRAPGKRMALKDFAGRIGCCRDHFIRLFKAYKGMTPNEFIIRARMESAQNLLLFSSLSISAIAESLGYCDQYHFSRQFKKHVGCPPSDYRRGRR